MFKSLIIMFLFLSGCNKSDLVNVEVVKVIDGDTIKVMLDNKEQNIRLARIDCYETYNNSRAKKQIKYYNRPIVEVYNNNKENINDKLLSGGGCLIYER